MGDSLGMVAGTMEIVGNALAGNTLKLGQAQGTNTSSVTLLNNNAPANLEVVAQATQSLAIRAGRTGEIGADTLNLRNDYPGSANATISIDAKTVLTANFNLVFSTLAVSGPVDSALVNTGTSVIAGSTAVFHEQVAGTGAFTIDSAQSRAGSVEFGGAVSAGQTVAVSSDPGRDVTSTVKVDAPATFKGLVNLHANAELDLVGLANADSYTLRNDILTLYAGDTVLDAIRVRVGSRPAGYPGANFQFTVSHNAGGIAVRYSDRVPTGALLQVHGVPTT